MKTVTNITCSQNHSTSKFHATCKSHVGKLEQWGNTENEALGNLENHVKVQGGEWPQILLVQ